MIFPPYLRKGDFVAAISPSGCVEETALSSGVEILKSWDLKVKIGKHALIKSGRFAGTSSQRLADLQSALDDPKIKAIFCNRGGFGISHLLDRIDWSGFSKNPKWIIGYSDITALHFAIQQQGVASIHAMMTAALGKEEALTSLPLLRSFLFGTNAEWSFPITKNDRPRNTSGQIIGGNLSLITHLIGTKDFSLSKGKLLFIEEVGEPMYKIDRMLWQLKRACLLENLSGLLLGYFTNISEQKDYSDSLEELILDLVAEYNLPVFFGFPSGHEFPHFPVIMGAQAEIKVIENIAYISFKK
ncbi:S66 peptidase family protein [Peijinzhouia sedimentorum]